MTEVGKAYIEVRADDSKLPSDLNKVQGEMERFASTLKNVITGYLSVTALKSFADGMIGIANSVADSVDQLADFSEVSGVALDKVRQLKYAVEASGQSWEAVQSSIARFGRTVGEAATGMGDSKKIFDALKISLRDGAGNLRTTEDLLMAVADRFKLLKSEQEKSAVATALFGRTSYELIPILNKGSEGIKRLMTEASSMGLTLTQANVAMVNSFMETRAQFDATIGQVKMELGMALMPVLADLAKNIRAALLGPDGRLRSEVVGMIDSAVGAFKSFADIVVRNAPNILAAMESIAKVMQGIAWLINTSAEGWGRLSGQAQLMEIAAAEKHSERTVGDYMRYQWARARQATRPYQGPTFLDEMAATLGKATQGYDLMSFSLGNLGKAAKTATDSFAAFDKELEIQIKLANMNYDALLRMGEAVRQSIVGPGGAGMPSDITQGIVPERPGGIPNLLEQFPDMAEWNMTVFDASWIQRYTEAYFELWNVMTGMPIGDAFMSMFQAAMIIDAASYEDKLNQLLDITLLFGLKLGEVKQLVDDGLVNFFNQAGMDGFKNMGQKMKQLMASIFGEILKQLGKYLIGLGTGNIIMSLWPFSPKQFAIGLLQVAAGGALVAGGGLIGGWANAGGGGEASGAASSYQTGGRTSAQSIEPVQYSLSQGQGAAAGGGTTNVTINAMDSQSFSEYLKTHGRDAVAEIAYDDYRSNGAFRQSLRG